MRNFFRTSRMIITNILFIMYMIVIGEKLITNRSGEKEEQKAFLLVDYNNKTKCPY